MRNQKGEERGCWPCFSAIEEFKGHTRDTRRQKGKISALCAVGMGGKLEMGNQSGWFRKGFLAVGARL